MALDAVVKARNEGRDLVAEGPDILKADARHSPDLRQALELWQEIRFEVFEATGALDRVEARS